LVATAEHLRSEHGAAGELIGLDTSSDDLRESTDDLFDWIVQSGDKDDLELFAQQLAAELQSRQDPGHPQRPVFVFIDDIQQLYDVYAYGHDDAAMIATWADLIRRGRRLGIHVLATAPTLQFGSASLRGAFRHRFQLRPRPDDLDLVPEAATLPTAVALDERGRQVKFFAPQRRLLPAPGPARRFGPLPETVELNAKGAPAGVAILGIGEIDRAPVEVGARPGIPLLVTGPGEAKRLAIMRWITDELAREGTLAIDVGASFRGQNADDVVASIEGSLSPDSHVLLFPEMHAEPDGDLTWCQNVYRELVGKYPIVASFDPTALGAMSPVRLKDVVRPGVGHRILLLGPTRAGMSDIHELANSSRLGTGYDLQGSLRCVLSESGAQKAIHIPSWSG
ncbi:MAG: hypothetical protein GY704_05765, partial [Phycisphaeraceae bacterium]|nr:hypothetical protein [Phycisphaeraceae bacterium]